MMQMDSEPNILTPPYIRKVNWKEFVCGWGAAFVNISVTYPLNKIIFRQMLYGLGINGAFQQLHKEGLSFLYRGILPPLCQKTLSLSLMFGVYEEVHRPLVQSGANEYVAKLAGGLISGSVEAILMPFERIQTLLADYSYHNKFRNTYHAFKVVGLQYGIREYYRGLIPILLRNGPSNVCFFILRDESHKYIPKCESPMQRTFCEFVAGACIGAFLSNLFYPINVIKVSMHSKLGGKYENMVEVFLQIYRERGNSIRHFYKGVHANSTRAFISWGVVNAAYEIIKKYLY